MKMQPTIVLMVVLFLASIGTGLWGAEPDPSPAFGLTVAANPGSKDEQMKKAQKLYEQMAALPQDDLESLERLQVAVITECPDTHLAQKSIWMLSNMFEFAFDEPLADKQATLLEHLFAKYPESPYVPMLLNRICNTFRRQNLPDRLVALYQTTLTHPQVDDKSFVIYGLDYAKALHETGQADAAKKILEEVIRRDQAKESFECLVARDLLAKW